MSVTSTDSPYLFVVRDGPVWSIENHLRFLAKVFGSRFEGEIRTYSDEPGFLREGGFTVRRIVWKPQKSSPFARLYYTLRVVARAMRLRWLQHRRLIVIAYDPFQSGLIACLVKWTTGAPFICEINGVYGEDANLIDIPDPKRRQAKKKAMLRLGAFVLRRADFIKTLFPGQLQGFETFVGDTPRAWFLNPVDAEVFQPEGLEPQRRLAFVGHPLHRKGVDVLLEAFALTREDFPDWRLIVIGWDVERSARALGLPIDGVDFLPPQPPDVLAQEIEASAALILPSRSEAMGRVLIETAFLGRPRLGSRVGGIPYYVEDDVDGLLFESEDMEELSVVLRRFMRDPELRIRLGKAARIRATRDFTGDEYVRRYTEVFEQVLG